MSPRRPSHPKSTRQQFSACGACRMRRVRCDLKDLPLPTAGCSNCKERGLKCVDEFAGVKTVKLLRRGRRLQQVEAIYGKINSSDHPPSLIPQLHPDFFSSPFWHRFILQRPVIDPVEFPARFLSDSRPLSPEASIIASLLVVWAASFGLDERGVDVLDSDHDNRRNRRDHIHAMLREILHLIDMHAIMRRPSPDGVRVLLLISPLLEELLPPLDILTMYETTIAQVHALSIHAPSLSIHSSASSTINPYATDALVKARIFWYAFVHEGITTALRGGRLILDEEDLESFQSTLPQFGSTLPGSLSSPVSATFPAPHSTGDGLHSVHLAHLHMPSQQQQQQHTRVNPHFPPASQQAFLLTAHLFSLPLRLSAVCRKVHATLTGRDARRRAERGLPIDSDRVQEIWNGLDACWEEFDAMRTSAIGIAPAEMERYVGSWQIFIFECHNIVREALKQIVILHSPPGSASPTSICTLCFPSTPPSSSTLSPHRLHALAVRRCMRLLPCVLGLIKIHLDTKGDGTELFRWDSGLIGDGCFFAGFLAAGGELDYVGCSGEHAGFTPDCGFMNGGEVGEGMVMGVGIGMKQEEGVEVCLKALNQMRWAFAKGEEREQTIRMVWEMRGRHSLMKEYQTHEPGWVEILGGYRTQPVHHHRHNHHHHSQQHPHPSQFDDALHHAIAQGVRANGGVGRPMLPPLTLSLSPRETQLLLDAGSGSGSGSTPHTGGTDGSASGWPVYTPPGTGTSGGSGRSGGISGGEGGGGSPRSVYAPGQQQHVFQKSEEMEMPVSVPREGFYHPHQGEMETFSFSVPETMMVGVGYQQQQQQQQQGQGQLLSHSLSHHQQIHTIHPNGAYLDVFSTTAAAVPSSVPVSVSGMNGTGGNTRCHSVSDDGNGIGPDECHGFLRV